MIEYRIGALPGTQTRGFTEIKHVHTGEFFVDEQRLGPTASGTTSTIFVPNPAACT